MSHMGRLGSLAVIGPLQIRDVELVRAHDRRDDVTVLKASWSCIISPMMDGTICQDRPNLSLSQPHRPFSLPAESFTEPSMPFGKASAAPSMTSLPTNV